MDIDFEAIKQRWIDLNTGNPNEAASGARYKIGGTPEFGVYLLIMYPAKTPSLEMGPLLPDLTKSSPLPVMKGVDLHFVSDSGKLYLSMDLKQSGATDVFLILAGKLCEKLAEISTPVTAYGIVTDVLIHWQNFFESEKNTLSESQQTGLVGELLFLDSLIKNNISKRNALKSWKGSERSHHDFHFHGMSIEVKSTTAIRTDTVSITNLRQLENIGTDTLYLVQVALDVHDNGANTLPAIISSLRSALKESNADILIFEEKLLKAGYRDADQEHYQSRSYSLRKIRSFYVDDEFPKLTTLNVSEGVLSASYKISLSSAENKVLSNNDFLELLKEIISERD